MERNNENEMVRNRVITARHIIGQADGVLEELEKALTRARIKLAEYIILHHSFSSDGQTVNWDAMWKFHTSWAYEGTIINERMAKQLRAQGKDVKEPWDDIGYHFGIELVNKRYQILVGRMMTESGAHCKQHGMNHNSIGICFVGNFDNEPPPAEQWDLGVKLTKSLMAVLGIPAVNVRGHREFAKYKSCPGRKFNLDVFRASL